MAAKELESGFIIANEGQLFTSLHIITKGTVKAKFSGGELLLKKGDVIGLCDVAFDSNFFTYVVDTPVSLVSFPCKSTAQLKELLRTNKEIAGMMYNSMVNQVLLILTQYARAKDNCSKIYSQSLEFYDKYMSICAKNNIIARSLPQFDSFTELNLDEDINEWMLGYYASFREFPADLKSCLYDFPAYVTGFLNKTSIDIHSTFSVIEAMNDYYGEKMSIFMQENGIDMFDLYTALLFRLKPSSPDAELLKKLIDQMIEIIKAHPVLSTDTVYERVSAYRTKMQTMVGAPEQSQDEALDPKAAKELSNSLDVILEYGGIDDEKANNFRLLITKYKKLSDKTSTEDDARSLRLALSKAFYEIYADVFRMSLQEYKPPTIIKMFLNFGYVDEELAGAENANYIYNLAGSFNGDKEHGIYTSYEWLKSIYNLEKDPSRNEFDMDYLAKLHELKVQGKITADDEVRLAKDPDERLNFELENMFPMVNKVTFGRLSIFCPVFSEHNIIKPLSSCLVSPDAIAETINRIKSVDYGAFYRETLYTNEAAGIPKETVAVEVMPDIILTPNIGTRAVMWQEIEGRKRTTPARFVISIFHQEELITSFTRLVGEFRWELCKRIQGARWNDVTDKSLTSEYFDYVQFYRKNNDLSQEAKEKIKTSLVKAKNSFKEMFVRDYITWVIYEGSGSPRLNKIARGIMCTYCPFSYELRKKMAANPLFKEMFDHFDVKLAQKLHHLDNVIQKLNSSGVPVPEEIITHRRFIEGK